MNYSNRPRPTQVPLRNIPVRRDITVTPTSFTAINTMPDGTVRSSEFWMDEGILWQRTSDGLTIRHTTATAHLRKLLNDNR